MWTWTSPNSDTTGKNLLEVGYLNGYSPSGTGCTTGSTNAQLYWYNWDSNAAVTTTIFGTQTSDSSNHTFTIERDPNNINNWDEYYDGSLFKYATGQNSSTAYQQQAGLELSENVGALSLTWATVSTIHNSMTYEDTNGNWVDWSYYNTFRDQPCGSYPAGDCTNGSAPWIGEWDVNRG
jgi:hypothetical protein